LVAPYSENERSVGLVRVFSLPDIIGKRRTRVIILVFRCGDKDEVLFLGIYNIESGIQVEKNLEDAYGYVIDILNAFKLLSQVEEGLEGIALDPGKAVFRVISLFLFNPCCHTP
jgi:hypothetical protein